MKAQKVIITIKIEALSIDTLGSLLSDVVENVRTNEAESGFLQMVDGDQVEWKTERQDVEF